MKFHCNLRFLSAVLILAGLFSTGCNQGPQTGSPHGEFTVTVERPQKVTTDSESEKPETIASLIRAADVALSEGNVEGVKKAIAKLEPKSSDDFRAKMDIGRILFAIGEMKRSAQSYDNVLELMPALKPQLWQRGLALYYADEFEKGVDQFDTHQTFNSQDVENSVWQLLCQSKVTSVDEARKSMIQIEGDTRIPMKQVFELFAGTGSPEKVLEAVEYKEGEIRRDSSLYHAFIYIGLFHEMMGDQDASNKAMKQALLCKPPMIGLMAHVAEGHLRIRNAIDVTERSASSN